METGVAWPSRTQRVLQHETCGKNRSYLIRIPWVRQHHKYAATACRFRRNPVSCTDYRVGKYLLITELRRSDPPHRCRSHHTRRRRWHLHPDPRGEQYIPRGNSCRRGEEPSCRRNRTTPCRPLYPAGRWPPLRARSFTAWCKVEVAIFAVGRIEHGTSVGSVRSRIRHIESKCADFSTIVKVPRTAERIEREPFFCFSRALFATHTKLIMKVCLFMPKEISGNSLVVNDGSDQDR